MKEGLLTEVIKSLPDLIRSEGEVVVADRQRRRRYEPVLVLVPCKMNIYRK